jgi:dTDP-4-dehydrorhamnose reductase
VSEKLVVVVTGAGGILGRALALELPRVGFEVRSLSRADLDVTDGRAVAGAFREHRPAAVVHAAAYTDVDGAETDAPRCMRVNAVGAEIAARESAALGARFVYPSTDFVFDGSKGKPYCEYDPPRPRGVYATSKYWGELLVAGAHPGALVVRTQWLFGSGGPDFATKILARAREGRPFEVVEDQVGCPTYTRDLARAIGLLLREETSGIYHCANRGETSWFEFARAIVKAAGLEEDLVRPTTAQRLARPAPRPAYSTLRNLRLELTLGDPMRPWREALREALEEVRR